MSSIWKSSTSCAASFTTRPPEPRDCHVSYPIAKFFFVCSRRGCFHSSPADFPFTGAKLLLPAGSGISCFWTRKFLPRVFPYAATSPFLRYFPPPAPAGSTFSCGLIPHQFAALHSSIWVRITVCQTAVFSPACCTLIWRVPCQHYSWFKSFRYVVLVVPVLVGWFEDFVCRHIDQSRRFCISCTVVGSFFFFIGVSVRPIAG